MLSSISWERYLAAIVILSVSYYGYVILRYYQQEISNLFNRKQNNANLFPNASVASANVMGAAKLDVGVSLTKSEELHFTDSSPDEVEPNATTNVTPISNTELSYSPSVELETEAGNLIKAFEEINNKPEFITLLRILINSYKRFQDEIDLPATLNRIVEISKERLMFPLSLTDLQETWA
ncbi:hypothetical protein ABIB62_004407 [Mucilaginibacter sp. UYP25]|uniref:hypothetical protein n=1 Tax=unclassified Mucilaginibacter TaxID=2617802 RepID=UPI0033912A68